MRNTLSEGKFVGERRGAVLVPIALLQVRTQSGKNAQEFFPLSPLPYPGVNHHGNHVECDSDKVQDAVLAVGFVRSRAMIDSEVKGSRSRHSKTI